MARCVVSLKKETRSNTSERYRALAASSPCSVLNSISLELISCLRAGSPPPSWPPLYSHMLSSLHRRPVSYRVHSRSSFPRTLSPSRAVYTRSFNTSLKSQRRHGGARFAVLLRATPCYIVRTLLPSFITMRWCTTFRAPQHRIHTLHN